MKMKMKIIVSLLSLFGQVLSMEQRQPNLQDTNKALVQAIIKKNIIQTKELLEQGANPNLTLPTKMGKLTLVELAVMQQDAPTLEALIAKNAALETHNLEGHTPLIRAAYFNNYELAKVLLKGNANVNATSLGSRSTAFKYAYEHRNYALIDILISFGFDLNIIGLTEKRSMEYTLRDYNKGLGRYPIDQLLDVAKNNPNVLISNYSEEAFVQRMPALHFLLKKFYCIAHTNEERKEIYNNVQQNDIRTPTEIIVSSIFEQIEKGYNINVSDSENFTPLEIAFINSDADMVRYILERHPNCALRKDIKSITSIGGMKIITGSIIKHEQYLAYASLHQMTDIVSTLQSLLTPPSMSNATTLISNDLTKALTLTNEEELVNYLYALSKEAQAELLKEIEQEKALLSNKPEELSNEEYKRRLEDISSIVHYA